MVWRSDAPQGGESAKIRHLALPYCHGKGLDLGCGPKCWPYMIGVDTAYHEGLPVGDMVMDASKPMPFLSGSMDFCFSAHYLEHVEDHKAALAEWWRMIRVGGSLVLYLPHRDLYPHVGEEWANPDHKHDFHPDDIIEAMNEVAAQSGYDLLENQTRNERDEYSFFQVFSKRADGKVNHCVWKKPGPTALVIRYGAFGDHMMVSSILPQLKAQGFHVTYQTTPRGYDLLRLDPNIDYFWLQDDDAVPNPALGAYWKAIEREGRFDRIVNLCESVEGTLLTLPGRVTHAYPDEVRRNLCAVNYVERTHDLAQVPRVFRQRFYPSDAEVAKAREIKGGLCPNGEPLVVWALTGSSVHKLWPYTDVVAAWLMQKTDASIAFLGDKDSKEIEGAIRVNMERYFGDTSHDKRIAYLSGVTPIRQSLALAQVADVVAGPETGVLNAVAHEPMRKVVILSHSSVENLTRDWVNTTSLTADTSAAPCYPCHRMHYGREFCPKDEATAAALCAAAIKPVDVFKAVASTFRPLALAAD